MTNKPRKDLPGRYEPGTPILAKDLNAIVNAITRRMVGSGGIRVTTVGNAITFSFDGGDARPQRPFRAKIKSVEGDYLVCRTLDAQGAEGPNDIYVLKPWTLRRTPFDGQTVNGKAYTYSSNTARLNTTDSESQVVTQDYFVDAEIYVEEEEISTEVETGIFTNLVDKNNDSRQWCVPAS